jgi:hypothetical protein
VLSSFTYIRSPSFCFNLCNRCARAAAGFV